MVRQGGDQLSRRSVLGGIAAAGLTPVAVAATAEGKSATTTVLGDFEDGLDGWRTDGGNRLQTVEPEQPPHGVTNGSQALRVNVRGDGFPNIRKHDLKGVDLVENPYLLADVTPGRDSTVESSFTFQFRLHHSNGGGGGNGGRSARGNQNGNGNGKSAPVVASSEIVAGRGFTERLTWDLTSVDEEIRRNANRLQIQWYPTRYPPEKGPRGKQKQVEYQGSVDFDWIRVTSSPTEVAKQQQERQWRTLETEHGPYRDTTVEERTEDAERGQFVFDDGTTIPYEALVLDENKFELTIGSETHKFGDGWE